MNAVEMATPASFNEVRETILRRIMRAACVVGLLSVCVSWFVVVPFDVRGAVLGIVATLVVFGVTLLPRRVPALSYTYPWALVIVGLGLGMLQGPRTETFLLVSGGLFIASLVLERRALLVLVAATLILGLAVFVPSLRHGGQEVRSIWSNGLGTVLAVVLPAAIAGRMIVQTLRDALAERGTLVQKLRDQSAEKERTLRELEQTRTQLTHAQKVELMGQLAGGLAHDMNNALTAVMCEASLLEGPALEARNHILESASYAAKLTHQLMVFARRDVSQPRSIDLGATIGGFLQSVRRVLPSEIVLGVQLPKEPVPVLADPTQVLQILLNLTNNAKDAMVGGGRLTVALERNEECARLQFSDTGVGIPTDVLPSIFEAFVTTKAAGQGTGLGLANVRQLVTAMGGTVEVESRVGAGTTFKIMLPLTALPLAAEKEPDAANRPQTGTVVVVDDDVRIRAVIFTALARAGFVVLDAATPEAALNLTRTHGGKVDLLLTDVVMAGGGGHTAIETMKREYPGVRVLVMSGYNADETLRRGIARGEYPFLAKPFTADSLTHAVERALA